MKIRNTYEELYLQRRDLEKRIESSKKHQKMLKQLKSQVNSQIRKHLTTKAMRSIKGYEDRRATANHNH